ncbi:MAG: xanthine phosphoribosyltransferase [Lactobacillus sp.]|jgi:xanthine phosphoribosyltransferase|nr:xanthine phosphoribosyltransferase [Lactobacillus sp.]
MPEKLTITWQELHKDTKALCRKIKKAGDFNKIVAVSRGGLVPAGILAYELNIRNSSVVNLISYDDDRKLDTAKVFGLDGEIDDKTIIVDDLSDTGSSIAILRNLYPQALYAVVYAKPEGLKAPDIYAKKMKDVWIVFPWD